MCIPLVSAVLGAAATAYSVQQNRQAAKDQEKALKKQEKRDRANASEQKRVADTDRLRERGRSFRTRRQAISPSTAATASSGFGSRSFFSAA